MVDKKSLDNIPKITQSTKNRKVSSDFLPGVFKTNTNKRFLNATMDQLIQEPKLSSIYGYVGRQDLSPSFRAEDPYIKELDSYSQYYQLEPGLVINKRMQGTNKFQKTNAFNYIDLLNGIAAEGGINTNHSRMFANEYYNYEGFVDLDKLINYSKYYWLANGPRTLNVNGYSVDQNKEEVLFIQDFDVNRPVFVPPTGNAIVNKPLGLSGFTIDQLPNKTNPTLNLVRGRTYNFKVTQPGHAFWIQTEPGLTEGVGFQENIYKRDVFGVTNNGAEEGVVSFKVPYVDEQYDIEALTTYGTIDLVTDIPYDQLQGVDYNEFMTSNSIDGLKSITTKRIVLTQIDQSTWGSVPEEQRTGIWQISNVNGTLELAFIENWPAGTKLFVREGRYYGNVNLIKSSAGNIFKEPYITAKFDTLYYQDGSDSSVYGEIRLVEIDPATATINVTERILNQTSYTSPNNVEFTNGLKIKFTGLVTPEEYANTEFIVEGVGTGIKLVKWEDLVTPDPNNPNDGDGFDSEEYDSAKYDLALNAPLRKDYIVMNRASVDGNAWSRTNRWFHEDVIKYATTWDNNEAAIVLDNSLRGIRPIIEFDADLQLFNHGNKFVRTVTVIDALVQDLSNQVEGFSPYVLIDDNGHYYSDNVALENGTFVVFTQEKYENTRGRIYQVSNIIPHAPQTRDKTTARFAQINSNTLYLGNTDYLYVNMKVSGIGIPSNTVITSIDSVNNIITVSGAFNADIPVNSTITFDTNNKQVHLTPVHEMSEGELIVAMSGATRQNSVYWWHNDEWQVAQQKTSINQQPLFDIFDINGISLSNKDYYTGSTFAGSKLFGFKQSTSSPRDSELNIPLSYRSIGNIGDIVFENFYDTDTFNYSLNDKDQSKNVSIGFAKQNVGSTYVLRNNWIKVEDPSKQYIEKKFTVTDFKKNNFLIDVNYTTNSLFEKNVFVFVNGKELDYTKDYTLLGQKNFVYLSLTNDLNPDDRLVVQIYGIPNHTKENYTLPKNLTDNSFNETFDSLTLGQIRNHLQEIAKNSLYFRGEASGSNNFRDINYKKIPGKILQHSAGVHIAQLFFNNDTTNLIEAIDFNRKSYRRFKDQLFSLVSTMEFSDTDNPRDCLDQILDEITFNNSSDQAFYYTDMIPYGTNNYTSNDYVIADTNYRKFNVINPFDITAPSYNSVLVYLKKANDYSGTIGNQLIIGQSYTFDGYVITLDHDLVLDINDTIYIVEYASTKGCMIPATPTKLGLYPKFIPEIYSDNTYLDSTTTVIQGHDGSKTVAFNDYRDDIILEFEKRVYNNLNVDYVNDESSFQSIEPGAFRKTEYSIDEWTQLLSISFLEWAGTNSVNVFDNLYLTNASQNDAFSFNYSQSVDKLFEEGVPGYWRGIYKYFYDTDRPHTHPWEMFGFSQKPTWWEGRYGPAPYTAGNLVLWKDVEAGVIYQHGNDSYVDSRYARPGVLDAIPVDEHGELLPPISSIITKFLTQAAGASWRFGDQSPQETAWRRSSEYPYAVQIAWALAKPAHYSTWALNRRDYKRVDALNQILNIKTSSRKIELLIANEEEFVPGTNVWIRDRLSNLNIDININFVELFKNMTLNLVYKMGGFTDKDYIEVIAEQASPNSSNNGILVPKENYDLVMTKSAPVGSATYSCVIIKKIGSVFSVYGADFDQPYFTVIPRKMTNNYYNIAISNSSAVVRLDDEESIQVIPYGQQFTTKQQVVDFLISYGSYLISLGFEFSSIGNEENLPEEANFSNSIRDWANSAKQFLYWTEQGWDDTIVLSLTPAGTKIKFDAGFGIVDDLTNAYTGIRLTNSDDTIMQTKDYTTYRDGTNFELILADSNKGIHLADLVVVTYEHTLVFDNITVFNDIVYNPSLGNRQYRLKINGTKTRDWDGSLSAPGFMINHRPIDMWEPVKDYYKGDIVEYKNAYFTAKAFVPGVVKFNDSDWMEINGSHLKKQLIPNMAFNAQQFEQFYDVDRFDVNRDADLQGRNATGFNPRGYLDDIGLNNVSQHKFYLGMIREKGTQAAVNAFLRAKLPYIDNNVELTEQYAVKLATYGSTENRSNIELDFKNAKLLNGAYLIELTDVANKKTEWNTYTAKDLLVKPAVFNKDIFAQTESYPMQVPLGGPVLMDDIDATVFNIQKINNLSGATLNKKAVDLTAAYGEGSRIWVASDTDNSWDVYRICGNENIRIISVAVDSSKNEFIFTCLKPHGLGINDSILIKKGSVSNTSSLLNGFYRINAVNQNSFRTPIYDGSPVVSGTMNAQLLKLKSVKYNSKSTFASDAPPGGWREGDMAWIETNTGYWEALRNNNSYILNQQLTPVFSGQSDNFGNGIAIKDTQDIMVVGAPGKNRGCVYVYMQDATGYWNAAHGIEPGDRNANQFGFSVEYNDKDFAVVGAPASNSNKGLAYVITTTSSEVGVQQALSINGISSNAKFGYSVTTSKDGNWIAVGAPGINTVYVFKYINVDIDRSETEYPKLITEDTISHDWQTEFEIPIYALDLGLTETDIRVTVNEKVLVPYLDYTVDSDIVTLTHAETSDFTVNIEYVSGYKLVDTFTNDEVSGSFGYSVDFNHNGSQLAVGAPTLAQSGLANVGSVYVYERTIEKFVTDGIVSTYTIENSPSHMDVYVDNASVDYSLVGLTITLAEVPSSDSILTAETNNFRLLEVKRPTAQAELKFGTKVLLDPSNTNLFVGAPGYNTDQYLGNGIVYRYSNDARRYGEILGQKTNPSVVGGHSIRLNGVRIEFTGASYSPRTILTWQPLTDYTMETYIKYNSTIYRPTQNFTSGSSFDTNSLTPYKVTLQEVVSDINAAKVPGVFASRSSTGRLLLTSDIAIANNKIIINSTDFGTALADLGITVYKVAQTIKNISEQSTSDFGTQLDVNTDGTRLVLGSTKSDNIKFVSFDGGNTTFDAKSTKTITRYYRSGAAHLYEYMADPDETAFNHGNFAYSKTFNSSNLVTNSYFGTGIAISNNWVMVSALGDGTKAGTLYSFYNKLGQNNWLTKRNKQNDVDTRKIERAYLFNDNTKQLIADLPIIDPEHGLPVVEAPEQIRYIVNYDPAIYSNSPSASSFAIDTRNSWGSEHVGELWWDTNQLKYTEWNQGSLIDKFNNWGLTVPNSKATVYEWVESDVVPSQYNVSNPTSLSAYTAGDVYSTKVFIDPQTLQPTTKYYFWVSNSTNSNEFTKRDTALQLQELIANPRKNNNEPFIAVVDTNAFALFNCQDVIDNDTVLHLSMRNNTYLAPVHTEWTLFDDGSDIGIATEFLDRIADSMSGEDKFGRIVPDPELNEKQKYGIDIRPRQSTYADMFAARKLWVDIVNSIFIKYPMVLLRDIASLNDFDAPPEVDGTNIKFVVDNEIELTYINQSFYHIGDKILVTNDSTVHGWSVRQLQIDPADSSKKVWEIVQVKTYDVRDYWTYADWYSDKITDKTPFNAIVNYEYEIPNINPTVGQLIKVKNDGNWKLVLVLENTLELVGQKDSTIQIKPELYDNLKAGFGVETQSFEIMSYSKDTANEFRRIFSAVTNTLLNKELRTEFKQVLKTMIDGIISQFKSNDWVMKTSLIGVNNKVRSLNQIPVYLRESTDTILNFINEVKPYHTKIKQYLNSYNSLDTASLDVVDFDLPAYYNKQMGKYRQPQLGNPIDFDGDTLILDKPIYRAWLQNHKYSVIYVDVNEGGINYTQSNTSVEIVGDGTGATAFPLIKDGAIYAIQVTDIGKNYTYATAKIIGDGVGAKAYVKLGKSNSRSLSSTLRFDRYTYEQICKEWVANTTYAATDLLNYRGHVYRITTDSNMNSEAAGITTAATFNFDNLVEYIVTKWQPNTPYLKDMILVYRGIPYVALTDFTSGRYFEYNTDITVTNSLDWQPETYYSAGTILNYGGNAYKVTTSFTTPNVFDNNSLLRVYDLAKYSGGYVDDASSRIWSYYNPGPGMPGKDLRQLMTGIEFDGVIVQGPTFDQIPSFGFELYERIAYDYRTYDENGLVDIYGDQEIDTNIYSFFNDAQLGLRTEDIIVDGAGYLDEIHSHAPEELVPGYMLDSLDIRVKTLSTYVDTKSPDIVVVSKFADGVTKVFSFDPIETSIALPVGGIENISILNDVSGAQEEGEDYIIDWYNKTITFTTAPMVPSSVFIVLTGNSGQRIVTNAEFVSDGERTEYEILDCSLENVQQVYIKVNGEKVTNWSLAKPNTVGGDNSLLGFDADEFDGQYWDRTRFPISPTWQPLTDYHVDDFITYNEASYRVERAFTSGVEFSAENLISASRTIVRFDQAPALNSVIQINLYDLDVATKAYSEIKQVSYTMPNNYVHGTAGLELALPELLQYNQPWEPNVRVSVNNLDLEPSNQAYYLGDGVSNTFSLAQTRNIDDVNVITDSDIVVTLNNQTLINVVDYNIVRNGIDIPSVVFNVTPKNNDKIVVSNRSDAAYYSYNDTSIIIKPSYQINPNDTVRITVFSNHDQYDVRTQVFSSFNNNEHSVTETAYLGWDIADFDNEYSWDEEFITTITAVGTVVDLGFDVIEWDTSTWDNARTNTISSPVYTLSRPVNNINYLRVSFNGIVLDPFYDYVLISPTVIRVNPAFGVTSKDIIVATHISENARIPDLEYRMFKGITESYEYLGIGNSTVTKLARDFAITDSWMYVDNTECLTYPDPDRALPGVVFVNGERITFYVMDAVNKRLGQLRRATNGTGAPAVHLAGLRVYDGGKQVEVPLSRDKYIVAENDTIIVGKKGDTKTVTAGQLIRQGSLWYNKGVSTAADGAGLVNSSTVQAEFLKSL